MFMEFFDRVPTRNKKFKNTDLLTIEVILIHEMIFKKNI